MQRNVKWIVYSQLDPDGVKQQYYTKRFDFRHESRKSYKYSKLKLYLLENNTL